MIPGSDAPRTIAEARARQPEPVWDPIDPDDDEPVVVCDIFGDDEGGRR